MNTDPAAARDATAQRPIADYGLLGDTRTAALVSSEGAIDWFCAPRFDDAPVFGRLVGGPEAGSFAAGPAQPAALVERRYRGHTATLVTTWTVGAGRLTLTEGMVAEIAGRLLPTTMLVRRLSAEGCPIIVRINFDPRRGEHHVAPRVRRRFGQDLVCEWGALALSLTCDPGLSVEPGRPTLVTVRPGQPVTLVLAVAHREPLIRVDPAAAWDRLIEDEGRWRAWSDDIGDRIPFRNSVVRSLVTLRLLTYSPSGAPVAAPTTSLPEHLDGIRNWDYRYAWPRDASIGVAAFLGVGKSEVAQGFLWWLLHASRLQRPRLPVLLTLDGRHAPGERELSGWEGYDHSAPVRIGNDAAEQHQLDGYGWVVDAAWVLVHNGYPLHGETWRMVCGFADLVARRWREPDAGIWEVRDDADHHVHSKMMGWLALDRALRIADTHRVSTSRRRRWRTAQDAIALEVRARGFDAAKGSYTRSYGSADLDAALLILPLIGIEEPHSPRVSGTVEAIRADLSAGGPLLYRYPPGRDGLPGTEGAFLPCSFWLVQALARIGLQTDARDVFEALLDRGTALGLFAEEMDPRTGAHLGNFPQSLTHAALVTAALALRDTSTTTSPDEGATPGRSSTDSGWLPDHGT